MRYAALEALDAPRGLSFEIGAVDDDVGGGLMGVANKQWVLTTKATEIRSHKSLFTTYYSYILQSIIKKHSEKNMLGAVFLEVCSLI